MGIGFNSNDYGITIKEWKVIKKELKTADKKDDNFQLSKADYKELKTSIKTGDLAAYLDKQGAEMQQALGLSLTGKVDGTDDLNKAKELVEVTNLGVRPDGKATDKAKVIQYILNANLKAIAETTEDTLEACLANGVENNVTRKGPFQELFV